jgi:hypothetical protein
MEEIKMTCAKCGKKFTKTSIIAIINKDAVVHISQHCSIEYLLDEEKKVPEDRRERISILDLALRFTDDYSISEKVISEENFKGYKLMYNKVFILSEKIAVKKIMRERIWKGVSIKYAKEIQYLRALNRIWEKQGEAMKLNFYKTFIPSVLKQFRSRGYLSGKQWTLVNQIVREKLDDVGRDYLYKSLHNADNINDLELPDKLRVLQRKQSWMIWFNKKNGILPDKIDQG